MEMMEMDFMEMDFMLLLWQVTLEIDYLLVVSV